MTAEISTKILATHFLQTDQAAEAIAKYLGLLGVMDFYTLDFEEDDHNWLDPTYFGETRPAKNFTCEEKSGQANRVYDECYGDPNATMLCKDDIELGPVDLGLNISIKYEQLSCFKRWYTPRGEWSKPTPAKRILDDQWYRVNIQIATSRSDVETQARYLEKIRTTYKRNEGGEENDELMIRWMIVSTVPLTQSDVIYIEAHDLKCAFIGVLFREFCLDKLNTASIEHELEFNNADYDSMLNWKPQDL